MVRLLGFGSNCGSITSKETGEVIPWSNRLLYCCTNDDLSDSQHGFRVFEQKLKTAQICTCFGLKCSRPDGTFDELSVDKFLESCINKEIIFKTGLTNKGLEVNGFVLVSQSK